MVADKLMFEIYQTMQCGIGEYTSDALKAVILQPLYIAHHSSYRDELFPGTKKLVALVEALLIVIGFCFQVTCLWKLILNRDVDYWKLNCFFYYALLIKK